ncbi:MAG: hypothetical protein GXO91_00085 [FCB group bacterium]|nr:hypothetical protein [FCB group bacterium]
MIRTFEQLYSVVDNLPPAGVTVVNPQQKSVFDALKTAEERGWIEPTLIRNDDPAKAAADGVAHVRKNDGQLLMKGDLSTAEVLKAVLDKSNGLHRRRKLSHVAVVESPEYDRLMLMTDGGVNPLQTPDVLEAMVLNAVELAHNLEIVHPNVALLAVVEKVSEAIPETLIARQLAEQFGERTDFTVEGPVALDVCSSERAARKKNITSTIAGKTDIFAGPNITAINFIVKSLSLFGHAKTAGIVLGAEVPVILLSRSDKMESKLNSIAIGIIAMKGMQKWI